MTVDNGNKQRPLPCPSICKVIENCEPAGILLEGKSINSTPVVMTGVRTSSQVFTTPNRELVRRSQSELLIYNTMSGRRITVELETKVGLKEKVRVDIDDDLQGIDNLPVAR